MRLTIDGTVEELAALALELASKGLSLASVPGQPPEGESGSELSTEHLTGASHEPAPEGLPKADPYDYPWDEAPEWAQWAATDESGRAWWYALEPVCGRISWDISSWRDKVEDFNKDLGTFPGDTWQDSLRARPKG